jgi:hypothetical protein
METKGKASDVAQALPSWALVGCTRFRSSRSSPTPQPRPKLLYLVQSVVDIGKRSSSKLKKVAAQGGIYRSASLVLPLIASCSDEAAGPSHHFWKFTPPLLPGHWVEFELTK